MQDPSFPIFLIDTAASPYFGFRIVYGRHGFIPWLVQPRKGTFVAGYALDSRGNRFRYTGERPGFPPAGLLRDILHHLLLPSLIFKAGAALGVFGPSFAPNSEHLEIGEFRAELTELVRQHDSTQRTTIPERDYSALERRLASQTDYRDCILALDRWVNELGTFPADS